jgi:hypothetical protein
MTTDSPQQHRLPIVYIVLALLAWGGLLALGAFLFRGQYDVRKPFIILACVGVFVGFWGLMIWVHRGRLLGRNRHKP